MRVTTTGVGPKSPGPVAAFSWLDWSRDGDDYVGGDYRIHLVEAHRWEVLHLGRHLRFDERLSSALAWAENHHIETVRRRDMITWSLVVVGSIFVGLLVSAAAGYNAGVIAIVSPIAAIVGLSGLARFLGAATRSRFDPYRRRAPWEPKTWWHRDTLGGASTQ